MHEVRRADRWGQWATPDPRGECVAFLKHYRNARRPDSVNVDAIGIGYNFALHLGDLGFPVNNFGPAGASIGVESKSDGGFDSGGQEERQ